MKLQIFCVCIIPLFFSSFTFAQSKPDWLVSLEGVITQKETLWKISNKLEKYENSGFDYYLRLDSKGKILAIQIMRLNNLPNAEETFAGATIAIRNIMGKNAVKTALKNFGDEAVLWRGNGFVRLEFRKKDTFAHVFTSSEITAKKFARYILDQMPKS